MKIWIHFICSILLLVGCSASRDSADYDITPGHGISNLVAVGMTTTEIRKSAPGVVVERLGRFHGSIPWLGASWVVEDVADEIYEIDFLIDHSVFAEGSPACKLQRFQGTLAGSISLAEPKTLQRKTLVDLFGEPDHSFDIQSSFTNINMIQMQQQIQARTQQGDSVSLLTAPATEVLSYPRHGIGVAMKSNIVYILQVSVKRE